MRKQQEELLPRFTKVWTFRSNDLVYDKTTCEFNILKYESNQNDCHSWCVQFVACWYTCFCKIVVNRSFVVFQYGHSKLRFWAGLWSRYSNFRFRLQLRASNFLAPAPTSWTFWHRIRIQNNLVRKTEKNIVLFVHLALAWTGTRTSGSGSTI